MVRRTALYKEGRAVSPAEKMQRRCSPARLPLLLSNDGPSEESRCTSLTMKQTSSYAAALMPQPVRNNQDCDNRKVDMIPMQ